MLSAQLFLPALLPDPPDSIRSSLPELDSLRRVLGRARLQSRPRSCFEAVVCAAFGLDVERELPIAALELLGEGTDPGAQHWLRADPVHLRAVHGDLVLIDALRLDITHGEAQAIVDSLDRHFCSDGFQFIAASPSRWLVRLPAPADLRTTPPAVAVGRRIDALLPRGDDALLFHRYANEAQMLLHDHPVNLARAQRGELEINSVWFWGSGALPAAPSPPGSCAGHWWCDNALARGLARCAGRPCDPAPRDAPTWLRHAEPGTHAVVLPESPPAEVAARRSFFLEWERTWLAPLTAALARGRLGEIVLVTHAMGAELRYALSRLDLLKVWRTTPRLPPLSRDG